MIDFSRFNSLFALTTYFDTPAKCRKAIVESRWADGDVVCPYCGQHHCHARKDGRFRCIHCKRNFSCLVGTIFENTKISLTQWFIAMYLISTHKKGISSVQLATDLGITQKTAWFILHKVRTLYSQHNVLALWGTVECDEMYLGGKETNKHESKKTAKTQGRSTKVKQPIFGMAMVWNTEDVDYETGEVKVKTHTLVNARKVENAKAETLIPIIEKYVKEGSLIITDELVAYSKIDPSKYTHAIVRHGVKEYVVGGNTTNGIEGYWGLFRRMVLGTYHFVSKKYIQRYIDESVYRFNTKELTAVDRFRDMFADAVGRCDYKAVKNVVVVA